MLRRTRLRTYTALRRLTPLRARRTDPKPVRTSRSVPTSLRTALARRSGGICEPQIPGFCWYWASEISHRQNTKMGGRHGAARLDNDRLSNVVHACGGCHRWTHANPTEAEVLGLQVHEGLDPAQVPVLRRGAPVYLCDAGGTYPYEAVGA